MYCYGLNQATSLTIDASCYDSGINQEFYNNLTLLNEMIVDLDIL
jgi:hypothetical protein